MAKGKKVNPFDKGVNYDDFLKALKDASIKTYLKGVCSAEQIQFVENEIKLYKSKKK